MQISERAVAMILGFEISSPEFYVSHLQSPIWPGLNSGVTIGIGYDLGQQSAAQLRADWADLLPTATLELLASVCGATGDAAVRLLPAVRGLVIPFSAASTVFEQRTLPRYLTGTATALANCIMLSEDSLGALVSLSYNRGYHAYDLTDDRHLEMREIKEMMLEQKFEEIPDLIRDMKRLWLTDKGQPLPGVSGLLTRRDQEAKLFEDGLAASDAPMTNRRGDVAVFFNKATTLLTNAVAPADTRAAHNADYNTPSESGVINIELLAGAAGAPTFSVQPQQGNDGTHWYNMGSAISALGLTTVTCTCPYFRIHVPTLSAGGLTVVCS